MTETEKGENDGESTFGSASASGMVSFASLATDPDTAAGKLAGGISRGLMFGGNTDDTASFAELASGVQNVGFRKDPDVGEKRRFLGYSYVYF